MSYPHHPDSLAGRLVREARELSGLTAERSGTGRPGWVALRNREDRIVWEGHRALRPTVHVYDPLGLLTAPDSD